MYAELDLDKPVKPADKSSTASDTTGSPAVNGGSTKDSSTPKLEKVLGYSLVTIWFITMLQELEDNVTYAVVEM